MKDAAASLKNASSLDRFVDAQAGVYPDVLRELRCGKKQTHWMWFIFPQLRGLGTSEMSIFFGLASADDAWAYLEHPVLSARLRECVDLVLSAASTRSVRQIFSSPDDLKLLSCLTLFAHVAPNDTLFEGALMRLFGGRRDYRTFELLGHED